MEEQYPAELPKLRDVAIQSEKLHSNITQDQLNDFRSEESCVWIFHLFNVYLDFLQNENGDLSTMWMSYIDMVDVVLGLIRASREGDWLLHLAMVIAILPWTFAYDKQNYARYLSVYYTQMTRLELDHPKHMTILKMEDFLCKLDHQTNLEEFLWTRLLRKRQTKTHRHQVGQKASVLKHVQLVDIIWLLSTETFAFTIWGKW